MNGPVAQAVSGNPAFAEQYTGFRNAAHEALGKALKAQVRHAVAQVHGLEFAPGDSAAPVQSDDEATQICVAYARRIPFEHTAITDAQAAQVVGAIGEPGYVALSVVAALADAECRAAMVDLPGLAA
ncbi:hypothetical protein [uncultured Erythrobacter sp.]|uniref:hypothetical protein n=1 Tax=uncultured Erythrobacter sp. TaxID=263913 RepID=UPI002602C142|nr:hypothetical protein [uncultured Erythrobacter sp.]